MDLAIKELEVSFEKELEHSNTLEQLNELKNKYLGKKGALQALFIQLRNVSANERPQKGKDLNDLRNTLEKKLEKKLKKLEKKAEQERIENEKIDVTLPARKKFIGKEHPISKFLDTVLNVLGKMGFSVATGPEIESDFFNFEALNFEKDHPARDMQDTFYIDNKHLLRTHTSNIQARFMATHRPPFRIAVPGKVYRNEDISVRSHVLFHQIDVFYVDKRVTFQDLIATLNAFFKMLFGSVKARFRPSFFPFVEPGLEADISCLICKQKGCKVCKNTGWLEILGAGLIHPNVLKTAAIDPEQYSGFAWGMGIERLLMILNGVEDIRLFLENDLRFLSQCS
jgi:phenylalanyl-tRNA synthetase alpha chain